MLEDMELEKQSRMLRAHRQEEFDDFSLEEEFKPEQIQLSKKAPEKKQEKVEFWDELKPNKQEGIVIKFGKDKDQGNNKGKEIQQASVEDQIIQMGEQFQD